MARRRSRSKKQSATKNKRSPDPVFFVDRSIESRSLVQSLENAGLRVEKHSDHFRPDAPDQEWLSHAGKKGWVVLHKDVHIRRRPLELDALTTAGVGAFVLVAGNMRGEQMIEVIERHLPKILRLARGQKRPFIAGITRTRVVLHPAKKGPR